MIEFGVRWDFLPKKDFPDTNGFSFLSLRLETFLKYGGPLSVFLEQAKSQTKLRYFSDYLPVSGAWDPVHQLAMQDFVKWTSPFYINCRAGIPEVPPPEKSARELLAALPSGVEVCFHARTMAEVNRIRDLNGIFLSIAVEDWVAGASELSHFADRVLEVEVDVTALERLGDCTKVIGEIMQGKEKRDLSVCVILPSTYQKEALERAREFVLRLKAELK